MLKPAASIHFLQPVLVIIIIIVVIFGNNNNCSDLW